MSCTGRLRAEVHPYILKPFTLLYTIFYRKGTPFVYLLLANGKWYLFRIPNLVRTMHPF